MSGLQVPSAIWKPTFPHALLLRCGIWDKVKAAFRVNFLVLTEMELSLQILISGSIQQHPSPLILSQSSIQFLTI